MLSLLPLLYLLSARAAGAGASDPNLPFMDYLDNEHKVCLKWGFDNPQGNITLKFIVNTTGWVGFGFSPNGGMGGADILIGGVGASETYFSDRHATGKFMPIVDEQQSYTLLSLVEIDGQTIMTVERTILACDDKDYQITAAPVKVIYAYGITDNIEYHGGRRGTKELNLLNFMPRTASTDPNFLSATVDNFTIPKDHTNYHCKVMKFPNLDAKEVYHVYKIEPVIDNIDMVHHMLLYSCPSDVTEAKEGECFKGDIGNHCIGVVAVWGVGAAVFELPEQAGIPFGGANSDQFYRLEIHYNNVFNEEGRKDSSGLRLYYTTQRRLHDVGYLTTGVTPGPGVKYDIPPKAIQFHTYGVCNTSLFSPLVNPVPEMHVFAVMLHTHLAGSKVRAALYRNGKQMGFVARDENYNFELQQATMLGKVITIKPGDEIAVECTYSTTSRTEVTRMGLGTTDEMCLAFLLYYPEHAIKTCVSHPNMEGASDNMSVGATTSDQDQIAALENHIKTLPQFQFVSTNNKYEVNTNGIIREMKLPPPVTCSASRLGASWIAGILILLWIAMMVV